MEVDATEVADTDVVRAPRPGGWRLGTAIGALFALVGAVVGMGRLGDNSFFTHLATGRVIIDTGSVPSADPYTFHALGEPWTVQSWLVSLAYAGSDELIGLAGPRLIHMALGAAVAAMIWWLTRAVVTLIPRVVVAGICLVAGAWMWAERPLMVGLLCFCLLFVLAERGSIWWALPLMWMWVNSHGSFPLALVLMAAMLAGRRLDGGDTSRLVRLTGAVAVGTLIGGLVSPAAGRILVFPLTALERSDQFQSVLEWQSPDFSDLGPRMFLAQLLLAMLVARRVRRWEVVIPAVLFVAAALLSVRNVPMAAVTLTPWLAAAAPTLGSLTSDARSRLGTALGAVAITGFVVAGFSLVGDDHLDPWGYPIAEILHLEDEGVLPSGARVAYEEKVGNYLEYRYGPTGDIFFDDRFDFYSRETLDEMIELRNGRRVLEVLDEYDIDVVIWKADSTIPEILRLSDDWSEDPAVEPLTGAPETDDRTTGWVIFRRR